MFVHLAIAPQACVQFEGEIENEYKCVTLKREYALIYGAKSSLFPVTKIERDMS